jgi:ankyrin repeat protein
MVLDPESSHTSLQQYKGSQEYIESNDLMESKVKIFSCGLAETVKSSNTRVVQFIHQSVKDFFSNGTVPLRQSDGTTLVRHVMETGTAHYSLFRTCMHYLTMEEIKEVESRDISRTGFSGNADRSCKAYSEFPLLWYAMHRWIVHLEVGLTGENCQQDFLHRFDWLSKNSLARWIVLYHLRYPRLCDWLPEGINFAHIAARHDGQLIMRTLLEQKDPPGVNEKDMRGRTPLCYAAEAGYDVLVKGLLDTKTVDVNARDIVKATPLHWAALNGHAMTISLLLENGADIEAKDATGCTPLAWAIEGLHISSITTLLAEDLDLDYVYILPHHRHSYTGWLSLFRSPTTHFVSVANLWRAEGKCPCSTPDDEYSMPDDTHNWWVLRDFAGRPQMGNHKNGDEGDRTPLLRAVELGWRTLVKMLLDKGASLSLQGRHGYSPLSLAKIKNNETIHQLLQAAQEDSTASYILPAGDKGPSPIDYFLVAAITFPHELLSSLGLVPAQHMGREISRDRTRMRNGASIGHRIRRRRETPRNDDISEE